MTSPEAAADLVARAQLVLLDFDGPICAVFAGYRAHEVAAQIMKHAANAGIVLRPADPDDPISVFKATAGMSPEAIAAVQDALVAEESRALSRTAPHPGIPELIGQLRERGHRLVVVTNNGADPVSEFIEHHDLAHDLDAVIGRDPHHPELLKPAPESITRALVLLDVPAEATVFVGDSITDVLAGQAAGVPVIGYANKPGKDQRLRDAGADAIITAMGDLVPARRLTS
jgi:HAD superfamily hydrolase (TIGR01509 family)